MTDRSSDAPLFQDADKQERLYAPEQVPGTPANTGDAPDDPALLPHDTVSGVPFVPVRGDLGQPYPIMAPAVTDVIHNEVDPDTASHNDD